MSGERKLVSKLSARLPSYRPSSRSSRSDWTLDPPQMRHRCAKCRQIIQPQRLFWARDGIEMGHRAAMPSDDHFFACFHLVQQFAQMGLRLSDIDCNHDP
jgi:hypothetical protein